MSMVEYWSVGATNSTNLPMGYGDISAHLLADWIPSFPTRVSSQLVGWPRLLTELVNSGGTDFLALRSELGRSEKQWKVFVSWMLGVAGTRHVLRQEGYRWVAPLSAFYQNAIQVVDLSQWNTSYPQGQLIAQKPAGSMARLMPDYVAIRPDPKGDEWAVAESKGTDASLAGMKNCPQNWTDQAANAELKFSGVQVQIARRLVVAARCNPSAVQPYTRRIQIRAWNHRTNPPKEPLRAASIEVIAAQLFGLSSNLGLRANAKALAVAAQMRREADPATLSTSTLKGLDVLNAEADSELRQRLQAHAEDQSRWSRGSVVMRTVTGAVTVDMQAATLNMLRTLRTVREVDELTEVVRGLDNELADWARGARQWHTDRRDFGWDPIGIEATVRFDE